MTRTTARRDAARPTPRILGHLLVQSALRLRDATALALAPLGLGPREFGLLNQVVAEPGCTQAGLGQRLRMDRTTTVALLDRLAGLGLIERTDDPADRRVYRIAATRTGLRLHERAAQEVAAVERDFLSALSASDAQALSAILERLHAAHGAAA